MNLKGRQSNRPHTSQLLRAILAAAVNEGVSTDRLHPVERETVLRRVCLNLTARHCECLRNGLTIELFVYYFARSQGKNRDPAHGHEED